MREAGGGARPTLVPWEELVRGRINKPEIFQTEVNACGMKNKDNVHHLQKKKTQLLIIFILWTMQKHPCSAIIQNVENGSRACSTAESYG